MRPALLLLDDESSVLSSLKRVFRCCEFDVLCASTGQEALDFLAHYDVAVVLSDLRMPEMSGVEFLRQARNLSPHTVRMVLSGYAHVKDITESVNSGSIYKFLTKPWSDQQLRREVDGAFQRYRLEVQQSQIRNIYESSLDVVIVVDAQGTIVSVNAAVQDVLGYRSEDIVGSNVSAIQSNASKTLFCTEFWQRMATEGKWRGELWVVSQSGTEASFWVYVSAVKNDFNRERGFVVAFSDISEVKQQQERLRHQASHDLLTGLPNRRFFEENLALALYKAQHSRTPLAVMFLDLNGFKAVNDAYGHSVGDQVLCMASERMRSAIRKSDVLARFGGDEFCILLPEVAREEDVEYVKEKIYRTMTEPFVLNDMLFNVFVSIGVSSFPSDGCWGKELIQRADVRMYDVKQGRRGEPRSISM